MDDDKSIAETVISGIAQLKERVDYAAAPIGRALASQKL